MILQFSTRRHEVWYGDCRSKVLAVGRQLILLFWPLREISFSRWQTQAVSMRQARSMTKTMEEPLLLPSTVDGSASASCHGIVVDVSRTVKRSDHASPDLDALDHETWKPLASAKKIQWCAFRQQQQQPLAHSQPQRFVTIISYYCTDH